MNRQSKEAADMMALGRPSCCLSENSKTFGYHTHLKRVKQSLRGTGVLFEQKSGRSGEFGLNRALQNVKGFELQILIIPNTNNHIKRLGLYYA